MPVVTSSRRTPTQVRSRERVSRILDEASKMVVSQGIDALTTRSVAVAAEIPVASVYQYFADRDAILLALVERDTAEMDEQVREDLGQLEVLSVASVVATTMNAYVAVYARTPAFVEIWLRGRTNPAIYDYCRQHDRRTAGELRDFAIGAGLARADTPVAATELAVEIGDRVFQLAYETKDEGDAFLIAEGIAMVTAYLLTYATPAGIDGIPA
ncbi:MAG: transcriptional regulator, TetR family [Marmoricola sp.]|nr:transcriptional regulator, TetR family [Marmoricola sp.]